MYTFKCERSACEWGDSPKTNITYEVHDEHASLDELLEEFTAFLRGCGYFIDGYLDVVNDEEPSDSGESFTVDLGEYSTPYEFSTTTYGEQPYGDVTVTINDEKIK